MAKTMEQLSLKEAKRLWQRQLCKLVAQEIKVYKNQYDQELVFEGTCLAVDLIGPNIILQIGKEIKVINNYQVAERKVD